MKACRNFPVHLADAISFYRDETIKIYEKLENFHALGCVEKNKSFFGLVFMREMRRI